MRVVWANRRQELVGDALPRGEYAERRALIAELARQPGAASAAGSMETFGRKPAFSRPKESSSKDFFLALFEKIFQSSKHPI